MIFLLCSHLPWSLKGGPLPMGAALYAAFLASPATFGTGLKTVWVVLVSNSKSGAESFTWSVVASGALRPDILSALPDWTSSKPAMPAMW